MSTRDGQWWTVRKTRFPELGYADFRGFWQFVTTEDGAQVGPRYATKAELLADLPRYAHFYGVNPEYAA